MQQVTGEVAGCLVLLGHPDAEDGPGEDDLALAVGTHHHIVEKGHRGEQGEVLKGAGDAQLGDAVGGDPEQLLAAELHRPG